MYGITASATNTDPMIIEAKDCHTLGLFTHTSAQGAEFKVQIYKKGTSELIKELPFDTYRLVLDGFVRDYDKSFEIPEGVDVTVKIIPLKRKAKQSSLEAYIFLKTKVTCRKNAAGHLKGCK